MNKLNAITEVETAEMLSWTPKERKLALADCMRVTAENIRRAAHILGAMEQAGDEMTGYPESFLSFMRRIRSGGMLPEAYMNYDGRLRRCVSQLPLPDQKALISGNKVALIVMRDGKTEALRIDPRDLQPNQVKQIFDRDHIRSESEQVAWLADTQRTERMAATPPADEPYEIKRGELIVHTPMRFDRDTLIDLLARMKK